MINKNLPRKNWFKLGTLEWRKKSKKTKDIEVGFVVCEGGKGRRWRGGVRRRRRKEMEEKGREKEGVVEGWKNFKIKNSRYYHITPPNKH